MHGQMAAATRGSPG